uniref:Uncharacterized protein n=1 Tax=Babesia bovis TaxID=5865 RepID=S6B7X9_BABBO|nr:hypothetical protein [Babesia bovis]
MSNSFDSILLTQTVVVVFCIYSIAFSNVFAFCLRCFAITSFHNCFFVLTSFLCSIS